MHLFCFLHDKESSLVFGIRIDRGEDVIALDYFSPYLLELLGSIC